MSTRRGFLLNGSSERQADNGQFTLPGFDVHYAPDLGLEPQHLELHLGVDLSRRAATGMAIWTFKARRDGVSGVELDAVEFNVDAVSDMAGAQRHVLWWTSRWL